MIRCTQQCQRVHLQLVSLVALLLAWVYIFDTVQREREMLEGPKEGIIGAGGLQDPSEVAHTTTVFPPDKEDSGKAKDEETGEMSGQAVNIPPQMLVDSADGRSIGDMYAPMQGNISISKAVSAEHYALHGWLCLALLNLRFLLCAAFLLYFATAPFAEAHLKSLCSICASLGGIIAAASCCDASHLTYVM